MFYGTRARDGYLYYENLGQLTLEGYEADYWAKTKKAAKNYFGKVEIARPQGANTATFLRNLANEEYQKEVRLLSSAFGFDISTWGERNYKKIIPALNETLNLKEVFERVVNRVNKSEATGGNRTTAIAATYGSYLRTRLNRAIPNFLRRKLVIESLVNGDTKSFEDMFSRLILENIDFALTDMFSARSELKGDDRRIWEPALEAIAQIDNFRGAFGKEFFSRYGFDAMKKAIVDEVMNGIDYEKAKQLTKTFYETKIKSKALESQSIAGSVAEYARQAFVAASAGKSAKARSSLIGKNNAFTTDMITVFGEGDIDFSKLIATNKREANAAMENFSKQLSDGVNHTTIVYENTKKYSLGKHFDEKGFDGGSRNINNIEGILDEIGTGSSNSLAFINKIKQTMPGMIYGENPSFREEMSKSLAAAVAYLLFDDIKTIGNATSNSAVHVFGLTDVVVPLSYFLHKVADAMDLAEDEIENYVKISFKYPSAALYDYPQPDRSPEASAARWEQQRLEGNSIQISIAFLKHFKALLRSDFKEFLR